MLVLINILIFVSFKFWFWEKASIFSAEKSSSAYSGDRKDILVSDEDPWGLDDAPIKAVAKYSMNITTSKINFV